MRCCVPGCKNDSRHISKSQGITFHVFPNEITLRTAWLRALNKVQWVPRERSAVCSEHFVSADLYQTRSGLRKVRVGAVPFILQDTLSCDYEPCNLNICRVCLAMDCKLFSINEYNLKQAYECLTGVTVYEGEKLPQMLCYECVARLNNCNRFRSQCVRANALMVDIIKKDDQLTIENIKTINRDTNQLNSPLLWEIYPPNHCNYHCEEDELKTEPIEIKSEKNEVYLTDDELIDDKQHVVNDIPHAVNDIPHAVNDIPHAVNDIPHAVNDIPHAVNDIPHAVNDIPHAVNDVPQDTNEILDNVHSDNDYSTDDSLPLQKARKKRKLEKKSVKVRKTLIKRDPTEPKVDRRRKPFLNGDLNETLFTITDLTHEEQLAEIDKRRESANYKNAVFKCTECYKGFLDEDAYNTHMTRHTDKCGEHACEICKTHFKHPHALRKHITAHHTQRFSCNQCVYVTTHRQTARLHERWHKGTKYHCPHCQDEFVKFTTYMGHIRIKHPSDFVCELCGYSFVSIKGIELHKKLKHRLEDGQVPEDGPFCELCNVRFVSMEAHRRHLNVSARHSAGREANKPKGRKSKETMEREKREREKNREPESKRRYPSQVRKAEGPIPCEQCGVQLEDSRAYHGHFRKVHPDKNRTKYPSMKSPCMCEVCGRMFQSHALLKDHRWVHTGERPFQCDSCDKSFRMKQRLVAHRRVHSQVKASYGCTLCGKNFSTHSNRQRHMFIHTGLKPFKCEMCGKGFKHASEKRAHITYVHLKKPWPKRSRGKRRSDSRQGMLPQHSIPTREMDTVQPIWPPCDPKMADMNMIEDKPMYYTLKI